MARSASARVWEIPPHSTLNYSEQTAKLKNTTHTHTTLHHSNSHLEVYRNIVEWKHTLIEENSLGIAYTQRWHCYNEIKLIRWWNSWYIRTFFDCWIEFGVTCQCHKHFFTVYTHTYTQFNMLWIPYHRLRYTVAIERVLCIFFAFLFCWCY